MCNNDEMPFHPEPVCCTKYNNPPSVRVFFFFFRVTSYYSTSLYWRLRAGSRRVTWSMVCSAVSKQKQTKGENKSKQPNQQKINWKMAPHGRGACSLSVVISLSSDPLSRAGIYTPGCLSEAMTSTTTQRSEGTGQCRQYVRCVLVWSNDINDDTTKWRDRTMSAICTMCTSLKQRHQRRHNEVKGPDNVGIM